MRLLVVCFGAPPYNGLSLWFGSCRQDAKPMEGRAGFQAILSDPSLEAVVLVLPPTIALQVCAHLLFHACTFACIEQTMSTNPPSGTVSSPLEHRCFAS